MWQWLSVSVWVPCLFCVYTQSRLNTQLPAYPDKIPVSSSDLWDLTPVSQALPYIAFSSYLSFYSYPLPSSCRLTYSLRPTPSQQAYATGPWACHPLSGATLQLYSPTLVLCSVASDTFSDRLVQNYTSHPTHSSFPRVVFYTFLSHLTHCWFFFVFTEASNPNL